MGFFSQARFLKSAPNLRSLPTDVGTEVAFIGYSNVGKSSAINRLTRAGLARTSKTPGRTQLLNAFALNEDGTQRLIDLPGYGYAKVPRAVKEQWTRTIDSYLTHRESLMGLVLVMDIRRSLRELDRLLLAWCFEAQCPAHILLTKADKLSRGAGQNALLALSQANVIKKSVNNQMVSVQLFSSATQLGVPEVCNILTDWLSSTLS